nr:hypothetical protein [Boldiaceae sp.]
MTNYYFAAASKRFLLFEEPLEEILRERINNYKLNNKILDFWLLDYKTLAQNIDLGLLQQKLNEPIIVIVSTNYTFIRWIKLRIVYVYIGQFSLVKSNNFLLEQNLLNYYILKEKV